MTAAVAALAGAALAACSHPTTFERGDERAEVASSTPSPTPAAPAAQGDLHVGAAAPDFTVRTIDSRTFSLASAHTPVLVEFFAAWSSHSQKLAPPLSNIARRLGGKVAVIAIDSTEVGPDGRSPETPGDVARFASTFGARYPIARDPDGAVLRKYGVPAEYPTFVLVGRDRRVDWLYQGSPTEKELIDAIGAAS
jgi:thiol-disulfide isomerase/thioredoxin